MSARQTEKTVMCQEGESAETATQQRFFHSAIHAASIDSLIPGI